MTHTTQSITIATRYGQIVLATTACALDAAGRAGTFPHSTHLVGVDVTIEPAECSCDRDDDDDALERFDGSGIDPRAIELARELMRVAKGSQ